MMSEQEVQLEQMYRGCAYITLKRACRWLGISKNTFYRYLKLGIITVVKRLPSNQIRIDRPTLERIHEELIHAELLGERVREPETLPLFPHLKK